MVKIVTEGESSFPKSPRSHGLPISDRADWTIDSREIIPELDGKIDLNNNREGTGGGWRLDVCV